MAMPIFFCKFLAKFRSFSAVSAVSAVSPGAELPNCKKFGILESLNFASPKLNPLNSELKLLNPDLRTIDPTGSILGDFGLTR